MWTFFISKSNLNQDSDSGHLTKPQVFFVLGGPGSGKGTYYFSKEVNAKTWSETTNSNISRLETYSGRNNRKVEPTPPRSKRTSNKVTEQFI